MLPTEIFNAPLCEAATAAYRLSGQKQKVSCLSRVAPYKVDGDRNRKCLGGKRRPGDWTSIRSAQTAGTVAIGFDFRSRFAARMVGGARECEGPVSVRTYCCWTILFCCKGLHRSQVHIYLIITNRDKAAVVSWYIIIILYSWKYAAHKHTANTILACFRLYFCECFRRMCTLFYGLSIWVIQTRPTLGILVFMYP